MDITPDRFAMIDAGESFARARAGEAEAFCHLTEPLQTRLLRQAAALSGDLSTAEDLVAETLAEAWTSLARYDESCRFSTWLYAILLHRHQKWKRRARSRPAALAWLPFFDAARNETSALMRECVGRLPEKHRRIILLRFYEDASLQDMAQVLGCPVGTVKSRLHHALEKLRGIKMNLPEMRGDTQI